jgi:hypothetical protein
MTVTGIQSNMNSGNTIIMLHVWGINVSIPTAQHIYMVGSATGDYHGQMNVTDFEKWVSINSFSAFHFNSNCPW